MGGLSEMKTFLERGEKNSTDEHFDITFIDKKTTTHQTGMTLVEQ